MTIATSLNAVTVVGPGTAVQFLSLQDQIAMQVITTGTPSSFLMHLEVSLNGTDWCQANSVTNQFAAIGAGGESESAPSALATLVRSFGFLCNWARANLVSFTGGASPTFTALIAARD